MTADRADLPSRLQRILIADDFPQAAETLAKWFRQLGFIVQTAQDGAQALDAAERFLPQLIILDIEMPKLTGYEVAKRVRQEPWGKNIVLVAFTALGTSEDRRRSLNAGFDDHLVKPVAFAKIVSLVSERWQQMSAGKTPEIATTPDQAAIRRAFELARRAFDRIREVEQRLGMGPKEMVLAADNREEYRWWVSINRQTQIERDSAYREFGEAQKSFAYLLSLHMKTSRGSARVRQQATGPRKFKYTQ